jgi:ankyrin repeat protein
MFRSQHKSLLKASKDGDLKKAKRAIKKGANVNVKDEDGFTPLHKASKEGNDAVVSLLLEKGGDIEAKTKDGWKPLHIACQNGHESIVSLLMEKGADIEAKDNLGGRTPLHFASLNGHESIASLLLKNGAKVNAKDSLGGMTPLYLASRRGDKAVLSLLLEKGANVNAKDSNGETPLHSASRGGHDDVVSLLLEKGANVNAKDKHGETPLHWACGNYGKTNIVSLLLEQGADVNAQKYDGRTPLHVACQNGKVGFIFLLLENGANINAKNNDGMTPLYVACYNRHDSTVSLLLENGADLSITNSNGKPPLQYAQEESNQDCVTAIEKFLKQKEYSEKFKTRAALDRELQRLHHFIDAAKDSLDPNVNSVAVNAKAEYEMIHPLCKWPQYMSISERELEVVRLEAKARVVESCEARFKVLQKIVQLRKTLEPGVQHGMKNPLQLAQERLLDEIRRNSIGNFTPKGLVNSWPMYKTVLQLQEKIDRLEEMAQGMDVGEERLQVFLERNKLKQDLGGEILEGTKTPLQLAQEKLPEDVQRIFTCPISGDIMKDPVILIPSGKTFNRESICTWLLRGTVPPLCPWTNQEVSRQIPYMENRDTRDFLIHYLGNEAYERCNDEIFKLQYEALWNAHDAELLFNEGVSYQDDDQFDVAEEYYEQAATLGHAGAQYHLAMLNEDNHERMLGYLEQAAAQDHPDALFYLGTLYFDSYVVPQDLNRAQEYFQRAAAQGNDEALEALRDT